VGNQLTASPELCLRDSADCRLELICRNRKQHKVSKLKQLGQGLDQRAWQHGLGSLYVLWAGARYASNHVACRGQSLTKNCANRASADYGDR
jgi:hypothetical protein